MFTSYPMLTIQLLFLLFGTTASVCVAVVTVTFICYSCLVNNNIYLLFLYTVSVNVYENLILQ